jgi:hypothetical protein
LASGASTFLASAQGSEVLCSLGSGVRKQQHHQSTNIFATNRNVKEDFGIIWTESLNDSEFLLVVDTDFVEEAAVGSLGLLVGV